jgi:hypothetical protein
MSQSVPRMICVDFDGTLCNFAYPGIGEPKAGAREALIRLRSLGYRIHIYSCRTCHWYPDIFLTTPEEIARSTFERKVAREMIEWLDQHDMPYDSIDDGSLGKPVADYYIDDKGIRFDDNWEKVAAAIELVTRGSGVRINGEGNCEVYDCR